MKVYPNFYESHDEAIRRLHHTVVMYDGEPYYVYGITAINPDGVFRAYLYPLGFDTTNGPRPWPDTDMYNSTNPALGPALDAWMTTDAGKRSGMIRKKLNSPKFNKFRPFPLGMYNDKSKCYYLERQPNRKGEQGLIRSMIDAATITAGVNGDSDEYVARERIDLFSPAFRSCIMNDHPPADECLARLLDPEITNEAVGFDRKFALVRGPIDLIFLAYKSDIVGVLPNNDLATLRLGRRYQHTREVVEELGLFNTVL